MASYSDLYHGTDDTISGGPLKWDLVMIYSQLLTQCFALNM